jgi:hypothetical protein
MTISSSSGGEMEEFNERVSDIFKSPVIQKIWQLKYRQILGIVLILFELMSVTALRADNTGVSRLFLVSSLYERVYNRQITELEAINTGLLEAYEDGQFHLEWPVSRGMAAEAFYNFSRQSDTSSVFPRAFADIDNNSKYKKILEVVGGAFMPRRRGRFDPNHVLSRKDLFKAINKLIDRGVFLQQDRYAMEIEVIKKPVSLIASATGAIDLDTDEIGLQPGFNKAHDFKQNFAQDARNRFAEANNRVPSEQINPQTMASIEEASLAMNDVDEILTSLGGSVLEMTSTYPSNPDDERVLRDGLAKIEGVLSMIIDRFKYAKAQLNTVMPMNPEQIKKYTNLEKRLNQSLEQAKILHKRIAARLSEPEKGTKNE